MRDLIRVEGIRVTYSIEGQTPKKVLDDINLTIHPGEFISVAGQTGCGKSTLLRLILGAERPTAGRVLIDGEEHIRPDRDRGYVPQKYSLFPDRTVLENIAFGPEMEQLSPFGFLLASQRRRREEIRRTALRYLRSMGLHERDGGKYPDQLSGGMQQRVAIAQALITRPKILLMDEAFSALDPGTRFGMQKLIRKMWQETGTTILFVTHNVAEAIFLSTRVIVLGAEPGREGSRVALDLPIPENCCHADGSPRQDQMAGLVSKIEEASRGSRLEFQMAGSGAGSTEAA